MKIIFCDTNKENLEALNNVFKGNDSFGFVCGQINSIQADCIVSPANSYGLMDGGVDRVINYTTNYISEKVQKIIQFQYKGEQPVGTCLIIPTDMNSPVKCQYKYLAHTPTMRVPKDVSNTDNAYLAFRALLSELINHNRQYNDINTIVMTSFCCGAGKMNPVQSALQMKCAYDCIIGNIPCSWDNANKINSILEQVNKK
jgi:O-acetyl-ADP-ribose deacetylase (regulator of RNase III)